jgi:hypothetical protein
MEEAILELRKREIEEAAVELSDFIRSNLFSLRLQQGRLRFHYEYLMSRFDEYERALVQHKMNAVEKFVKPS